MSLTMQLRRSPQLASFTLKTLSAAVLAATLIAPASAAGLGKLTVLSALGQPLNAEIELNSVSRDEAGGLSAKLASVEAYRQANIDINPALYSIRFTVEQRGTHPIIRVTSAQPMNEPFVDMLLELGGTNGRLVREYTFLLDPADLRSGQSASVAAVVPAPARTLRPQVESIPPAASKDVPERPAQAPVRKSARARPFQDASAADGAAKSYKVKRGDSLARIANQVRSKGVSLDQMLVAIYRANPNAFVGENMNRMRTGQILSIPSADAASGIANSDARGVVIAQAQDFANYRNKLAGQVASTSSQKAPASTQIAGGSIATKVEEQKNAATESRDKLKLSKSGIPAPSAVGAPAAAKAASGPTVEEQIAKDKAIAEANARVSELEKNVADLQKILELKNKTLAEQQKKAEAGVKQPAIGAAVAPPADKTLVSETTKKVVLPASANSVAATPAATPDVVKTTTATQEPVAPPAPSSTPSTTPVAVSTESVPASSTQLASQSPKAPIVVVKQQKPHVATPSPVESSFIDDLLGNAFVLPALGLILVGLGALGIVSSRRKKKNQQFEDSILTDSNLKANSLFGSTGGQSVDTNNSVFNSNFAPTAGELDANEVDPVAEADVYIAYGRDAQAEEILKEALRTQPERHAVRTKLLEIYAARKDVRSFDMMASELFGMTKGQGEDWAHAASMGAALDPDNPLYAGAKVPASMMPTATIAGAAVAADSVDFESLLATTHQHGLSSGASTASPSFDQNQRLPVSTEAAPLSGLAESREGMHAHDMLGGTNAFATPVVQAKQDAVSPLNNSMDFNLAALTLPQEPVHAATPPAHDSASHDLNSLNFDMPESMITPQSESHPQQAIAKTDIEHHVAPEIFAATAASLAAATIADTGLAHDRQTEHALNAAPLVAPMTFLHEPVVAKPDPLDFDLSGISLDLNPGDTAASPHAHTTVSSNLGGGSHDANDTVVLENESISDAPEMATKLDLAIAYEEIGDKEGARELLDEVIKGGSADQIVKAREMLSKLG